MAGGHKGNAMQVKLRGNILSHPVAISSLIHRGCMVNLKATGFAAQSGDTTGEVFAGIAEEGITAAEAVANGTVNVRVRRRGIFKMKLEAAAAAPTRVGSLVYVAVGQSATVDELVDIAANVTNNVLVGLVVKHGTDAQAKDGTSTADIWVDILGTNMTVYDATYTPTTTLASTAATAGYGAKGIGLYDVAAKFDADNVEDALAELVAITNGNGASLIGLEDSTGFTTAADVEAALAEIYQDLLSIQCFIGIPLNTFREATNFDVGNIAANGGLLASDSTPILEAINAATDGCQRINWAAANVDQIVTSIPLPPDLDTTKDLVLHLRIASESTTDAVGFTVDSFFNEGDDKVIDTSETNQTASYGEKIATIAAADIPAGAQTITIGLTPVAHGTDAMYMTAAWLEYARALRTS